LTSGKLDVRNSDGDNDELVYLSNFDGKDGLQIIQNTPLDSAQRIAQFYSNQVENVTDTVFEINVDNSGSTATGLLVDNDGSGKIAVFKQGSTERVVILNTGNVGIGTTSPSEKLDVKGAIIADTPNNDYGGIKIHDDSSGNYHSYIDMGRDHVSSEMIFRMRARSGTGAFGTGLEVEALKIDGTGDVEIPNGYIKAVDYYSGDGTQGYTGSCGSGTTLTVKDGLITACS